MSEEKQFKYIEEYLNKQAIVLDVRTQEEYNEGHAENSLHIVLDELESKIEYLRSLQKAVITCCRSGARSERAKDLLLANDLDAINGGPWQNVGNYI